MTITLSIPLILYFIFLAVYLIFIFVNLYHLIESASLTMASFAFTFFISAISIVVFYFTATLLMDTDWTTILFSNTNTDFSTTPF